jgi:hypothetical protein
MGTPSLRKRCVCNNCRGAKRIWRDGTHLRGDINILMVGDPSTGEISAVEIEQLTVAPLAISTTGKDHLVRDRERPRHPIPTRGKGDLKLVRWFWQIVVLYALD